MDLSETNDQNGQNKYEKLTIAIKELKTSMTNIENEIESIKLTLSSEEPDSESNYYKDIQKAKEEYRRVKRRVKLQSKKNWSRSRRYSFDGFFEPLASLADLDHLGPHISHIVHSAFSGVKEGMNEMFSFFSDIDFWDKVVDINFDSARWKEKFPRQRVQPGTNIRVEGIFKFGQSGNDNISLEGDFQRKILEKLKNQIQNHESLRQSFAFIEDSDFLLAVDQLSQKRLIIQEKSGQQRYMITKLGRKALSNPDKLKSEEKTMKSEDNDLGEN